MIPSVARNAASNLYWVVLIDGESKSQFTRTKEDVFGVVPPIMRGVGASSVRRGIRKALYAQGMGQRSRDEIYETGKADLAAVSMWLGDKPFSWERLRRQSMRALIHFLPVSSCLKSPLPITEHILPILWAYCGLMKKKYYET
jgi:hypothetical protein